jgi:pimeloyl-ACP methyl ester carboxylesterase
VRAFYAPIAASRTVVAYDKPGCGLSDPWPTPQTLDSDLEVLRTVIDHLKLGRVDLLGLSMGAPVSLAYAVQHPDGVGRLILYGGFANGHHVASAKLRTAMIELVRAHWGLGSDVLADIFLPDGTAEMKVRFAELQRRSTTAEVAAELLAQCYEIRVDDLLDRVAAPTLVLHRRDDRAIPYQLGRDLAARIPGARLVSLAGRSHWVFAGDARRWSARSWGSWAPPTAHCPPNRLRGRLPCSRHGSSRSRPWSPAASPTGRSPAGWGSRNARPRDTSSVSASGLA